jgi:elongation factor Ts
MAEISAAMVKALRETSGLGMMECKKALQDAGGDMKAALDLLRIRGGAKATRAAERIAAEGVVAAHVSSGGKTGALVEVNSETDFVARGEDFVNFAKAAARAAAEQDPADLELLRQGRLPSGETVEEARQALVMKLGENISVRRFARLSAQGSLACYVHGMRIGVLVDYSGGDEALGRDVAMHIAASRPIAVSKEEVPAALLAKEREIYAAQAAESGKPAAVIEKMVEGRIVKFLADVTLLGQPFVKNPEQTVEQLLAQKSARVHAFRMFVVGEGIEKPATDFAAEVKAAEGKPNQQPDVEPV